MKKDPNIFLVHILESINQIETNLSGISEVKFSQDITLQDATIRRLEIIGEAVKNLSLSFTKKHRNVPWKDIAGMRDKLIHHYFGVDMSAVWETCRRDLPDLKNKITKILG